MDGLAPDPVSLPRCLLPLVVLRLGWQGGQGRQVGRAAVSVEGGRMNSPQPPSFFRRFSLARGDGINGGGGGVDSPARSAVSPSLIVRHHQRQLLTVDDISPVFQKGTLHSGRVGVFIKICSNMV